MSKNGFQKTLELPVLLAGIGLHTGKPVHMVFKPAAINAGIHFRRTDLPGKPTIAALYSNVKDTRLSTLIGDDQGNTISTIEHVMAALYALGITNAVIEVDAPEIPIMDGSSIPFIKALENNVITQDAPYHVLRILKEVKVGDGDVYAVIKPSEKFSIHFDIDFPAVAIGKQSFDFDASTNDCVQDLLSARTFCLNHEIDYMRSKGLALGGTLENAIVVDGEKILNPEGLRYTDEFVRHKILDVVGDLFTSGFHVIGAFQGHKSSHALNNKLLRAVFADKSNFETIPVDALDVQEISRKAVA